MDPNIQQLDPSQIITLNPVNTNPVQTNEKAIKTYSGPGMASTGPTMAASSSGMNTIQTNPVSIDSLGIVQQPSTSLDDTVTTATFITVSQPMQNMIQFGTPITSGPQQPQVVASSSTMQQPQTPTQQVVMVLNNSEIPPPLQTHQPATAFVLGGTRAIRRLMDPSRAQQLWDAIKAVRQQKQIPAITRMSRYMNRFYQIKKDGTQRLLDAAVEDNLIKLERKVGTKGTKCGVEENAYR